MGNCYFCDIVLFWVCAVCAVYRYDPVIRKHYEWSQAPTSWSMQRYMFIHNALTNYQAEAKEIGERLHYTLRCMCNSVSVCP